MRACIKKEKKEEKFQISKIENDDLCDIRITTGTEDMTLDAYKQGTAIIKQEKQEIENNLQKQENETSFNKEEVELKLQKLGVDIKLQKVDDELKVSVTSHFCPLCCLLFSYVQE